jgi:hypothetical protein
MNLVSGLVFYWPILSSTTNDLVSGMNLTAQGTTSFMTDRFGNANGALYRTGLNYWTMPNGVYFYGDFTISGWVYLTATGLAPFSNNQIICFSSFVFLKFRFCILSGVFSRQLVHQHNRIGHIDHAG